MRKKCFFKEKKKIEVKYLYRQIVISIGVEEYSVAADIHQSKELLFQFSAHLVWLFIKFCALSAYPALYQAVKDITLALH